MVKLVGTGGNQVPTNNMLGNMAFQNKEGVSADLLSLAAGTASAPSLIPSGDTNTGMWFPAADTLALSTGGSERLRVTSTGNVGIGTATPSTKLDIVGGTNVSTELDYNYTAASLPSAAPALDLNFAMSEGVDQRISFTRATTATFVGSNGLIQTAAANVPRIEYDPVTLECRGLLIEEQRTNLLLRSADFDLSPWLLDNVTVTANSTVAPDGTSTADAIIENTATSTHSINTTATVALTPYTYSAYVKPNGRSWVRLFVFQSGIASNSVWFNVSTGVVGFASAGASNVSIRAAGNGWYRCSITFTPASAATASFYIALADADGVGSYTGNGTSGLFVWGAQAEAGSFATSYIPTTTVAVQRNADLASMPTSAFPYNATEGTVFISTIPYAIGVYTAYSLNDGTANNRVQSTLSSSQFHFLVSSGGVQQVNINAGTPIAGVITKVSGAYKENDFAASMNGGAAVVDTSGTVPTGINTLNVGMRNPTFEIFNGYIRQLTYFPRRLTNAQLQALTT